MRRKKKKIKIGGREHTIEYVQKIEYENQTLSGSFDGTRTIKISTGENTTEEQVHDTMLHEVCHAILFHAGLTNLISSEMEEAVVVAMEHGLGELVQFREGVIYD